MTNLYKIPIHFYAEEHTYTNVCNGKQLQGITSTLMRHLFPDKYAGVPQYILDNRAEHGSLVHKEIELAENIGINPTTEEAKAYLRIRNEYNLQCIATEFTVSDNENFATNIDAIYDVEDNVVDLCDFKTTAKFDREYVSWQLSICSYLLRLNNPEVKVRRLFGIWLRDNIEELIEVPARTDEEVKALITAYLAGEPYEYHSLVPDYIRTNEHLLYCLKKEIDRMTEEYEAIKKEILAKMQENGEKSYDCGSVLITVLEPQNKTSFDSKRFKEEQAEMYGKYMRTTVTTPSLKVTVR